MQRFRRGPKHAGLLHQPLTSEWRWCFFTLDKLHIPQYSASKYRHAISQQNAVSPVFRPEAILKQFGSELGLTDVASLKRWIANATPEEKLAAILSWYRREGLDLIENYRVARNALPGENRGAVSFIEANGLRYWGHNSTIPASAAQLLEEAGGLISVLPDGRKLFLGMDVDAQRRFRDFFKGTPEFADFALNEPKKFIATFSHAETQAFLRMIDDAITNHKGAIPKTIIIVTDRRLCPACEIAFERFRRYFKMDRITFMGRDSPLSDTFETFELK